MKTYPLRPVFLASFFFSFHVALLSYLNSTVLGSITGSLGTTLAYTSASALSLIAMYLAPLLVARVGTSRMLTIVLASSMALLGILGVLTSRDGFIGVFVIYFALNSVIWYAFDLVLEHYSREQNTGNIRGIYLTLNNIAWVLAPILASTIAIRFGFTGMYIIASIAVFISLLIVVATSRIKRSAHAPTLHLHQAFAQLVRHTEARRLVSLYFALQFFYAWMVLYMTPYLTSFGFGLPEIGIILSIMLLPFVLLQYLTGKIADLYRNERTLLIAGFCIMGLSTVLLALPDSMLGTPGLVFFATVLFVTRIGASIVEVAAESRFFKVVSEHDTALISTLRMMMPLSYIIAPLAGALVLALMGVSAIFVILGIIMFVAMLYAFRLNVK